MGMVEPRLARGTSHGVTLLEDAQRPGGVTFAFTERTGGVSGGCYASLNLGDNCGDDPACIAENRRRALAAIGALADEASLVCPRQVHGDRVIVVGDGGLTVAQAQVEARKGADAIVCLDAGVPVLLCFADCVPIVLAAPGAFAVVHSGWKGTMARIAACALDALAASCGCDLQDVCAYVGPCVSGADYEVSCDMAKGFVAEFGDSVLAGPRKVDLGTAVLQTLCEAGMEAKAIARAGISTASCTDRFFSYRASGGACGRHGALAYLPREHKRNEMG